MEKRYGALRFISTIFKILGVLVGFLTILIALAFCAGTAITGAALGNAGADLGLGPRMGMFGGVLGAIASLLVGAFYTLMLYAMGDGISLLIAMEENTRSTAVLIQRQLAAPTHASATAPVPATPANPPAHVESGQG